MKYVITFINVLFFTLVVSGQEFYRLNKDNTRYVLTSAGADILAALPLKCISQEYPNKTSHTSIGPDDHILLPSELHPVFFGCFDWHSSVHGHWMLIKLLKQFPNLKEKDKIRTLLNSSFTSEKIRGELAYFERPLTASWERTYGWAWILKLAEELEGWSDPDGLKWKKALQPLTAKIVEIWKKYLSKQTYPNRTGVHPNTAFGMVFALDYARKVGDMVFADSLKHSALLLFSGDVNAPASWEPNGSDFLSPTLEEADLMLRLMNADDFQKWFTRFVDDKSLLNLARLPIVSDRSDLQIVHLDGLSFSRSWCMRDIALQLQKSDFRRQMLIQSSMEHLSHALSNIVSGEYGGEHWLASFAVYALLED